MDRTDRLAIVALGLTSLLLQIPFLDRGISFYDEGSILAIADGLRQGAVMYRDHVTPTAPLTYELLRGLFDLFGPSLFVGRLAMAVVFSLCTVLVYAILRHFMPPRGAGLGALACLPVKTLGFPLWTIVNYSQLAMLFCLASVLMTLRFQGTRRVRWLAAAGAGVGLAVITKQNLGGLLGATLAVAVLLDAIREPGSAGLRVGRVVGYGAAMLAGALPPLLGTVAFYAGEGALGDLVRRAVVGLSYLTASYGLRFPLLFSGMSPSEVMFSYFPSSVAQMAWQGRFDIYASPLLYLGLANGVRVLYLAPLLAAVLAAIALVRDAVSGAPRAPWNGLVLLVLFALSTYASMLYRPDWTHLMNVFVPQLLLVWVVLWRWTRSARAAWLYPAVCAVWLVAGAIGAYAVFAGYNAPVETARGRLYGRPDEAENTRSVLAYLATQPSDARILVLRAEPLYYFLSGRHIPGTFDLVMPGILGPGDDEGIARSLRQIDEVIYNPKVLLTVPAPITEYAPETARILADAFRVARVLNPTAVVLAPKSAEAARDVTVAEPWRPAGAGRGARSLEPTSWMVYPVLGATISERDHWVCAGRPYTPARGEALAATAMLSPHSWVQVKGDPDYDERLVGARFRVTAATNGADPVVIYEGEQHRGETGEAVRVQLDRFAVQTMDIELCAALPGGVEWGPAYTVAGWAVPRIVRSSESRE